MIFKRIAVIKHNDFIIIDAILNNESNLEICYYKVTNEQCICHEELHYIKIQGYENMFRLFNLIYIIRHNIYLILV